MNIKNITQISEISNDFNKIKIGLFTDNSRPHLSLLFCNLIDDSFCYYNLREHFIGELVESNVILNVILINKKIDSKSLNLLFNYSKKHGTKIIYAPTEISDFDNQKEFIKNYDLIVVNDYKLKDSLSILNSNIFSIPHTFDEEYEFIKTSGYFDEDKYMSKYQLDTNEPFDSIEHYITLGVYEKCNPFNDLDLDGFLSSYPYLKKYNVNPFVYFVILNKLFLFNNYFPFDSIFSHSSLARLILWGNKDYVDDINKFLETEYVNDFYFEIDEMPNRLLFKQKNRILYSEQNYPIELFSKINLMIKNRSTGKRFLKEIKNFEVELTGNDLMNIDISGIFDIYVQISTLDKDFLFRVNFDSQNYNKMLLDKSNHKVFDPYETADNYLAFRYQRANFVVKTIDVVNDHEDLFLNGEIILLDDDLNIDSVELMMSLNQVDFDRKFIVCDYQKYDNIIKFTSKLDFKYYATDLSKNFRIDVRLKDNVGFILGSRALKGDKVDNLKINLKKFVKKSVFFESFHGKFYSGQPKYIYEKMLEMGLDNIYDFVWAYSGELEIPGSPLITARGSKEYNEILGASDYWISNISFPFLKPNDDIVYLQTTHGTPYKRMGSDIESDDENIARGTVLEESATWNYLLSPNDHSKEIFIRSFEYDGKVINRGYPANDIFYKDMDDKKNELKQKLNIDPNKKVILYCPTFRDYDVDESNHRKFSLLVDLEKLFNNLSDEYIIIMRLHYVLSRNLVISEEMQDCIIDLSNYDDITDLYLISDIMISDYSSAFFDFAHSKKPILFFVPDFEEYSSFRGLYSEVKESLPGPEIVTNDELVDCIKNIEDVKKQYEEKYEAFYNKFCSLGHGTASEDVINIVFGEDING